MGRLGRVKPELLGIVVGMVSTSLSAMFADFPNGPVLWVIRGAVVGMLVTTVARLTRRTRILERDVTTGLFLRGVAERRLEQCVKRGTIVTFAMIDVNRLKEVNDNLGHEVGDELLKEVANRLLPTFGWRDLTMNSRLHRKGQAVMRMGGDEFLVFCWGHRLDVKEFAGRVNDVLRKPHSYGDWPIAAVGVAQSQDAREALRNADLAMYRAKRQIKAQERSEPVATYDPQIDGVFPIAPRPRMRIRDGHYRVVI